MEAMSPLTAAATALLLHGTASRILDRTIRAIQMQQLQRASIMALQAMATRVITILLPKLMDMEAI